MFSNVKELLNFIQEKGIKQFDIRFCNLFGGWHHLNIPISRINEDFFKTGEAFDGSNVAGFTKLESGDLKIVPLIETAFFDPFFKYPTITAIGQVVEADTLKPYRKDPRGIVLKAAEYLKDSGIADESLWGPEFEFYILDSVEYGSEINWAGYKVESEEAVWMSSYKEPTKGTGYTIRKGAGYHAAPPLDKLSDLRNEMVSILEEDIGIPIRYHHHEVGGPGQCEIEPHLLPLKMVGDVTMLVKYIVKMVAAKNNRTATFMPKPLYGEAGSGLHFHLLLKNKGKNIFYDKNGYAGLSKTALSFIAGLLKHGPALLAFTNPSTNSFKRLVPGFEAPVNLFFSLANRSACIRIPKYATSEESKRFEFRTPDATCNPYLAIASMIMAGIDGVINNFDPTKEGFGPIDDNIFHWSEDKRKTIKPLPDSLSQALSALEKDHEFLMEKEVFSKDIIETWITRKSKEAMEIQSRPHPFEFEMYFAV